MVYLIFLFFVVYFSYLYYSATPKKEAVTDTNNAILELIEELCDKYEITYTPTSDSTGTAEFLVQNKTLVCYLTDPHRVSYIQANMKSLPNIVILETFSKIVDQDILVLRKPLENCDAK